MTLGHDLLVLASTVQGVVLLGTLVLVGKAVLAYRQHASRPMLLLAAGLFFLLVAPLVVDIAGSILIEGTPVTDPVVRDDAPIAAIGGLMLAEELARLVGVAAILASLYVRESPGPVDRA